MDFDGDWGSSTVLEERRMARKARFPIPADYRALSGGQAEPRSKTAAGGRERVVLGPGWRKPRIVSWRILRGRAHKKIAREYKEGICREEQQF